MPRYTCRESAETTSIGRRAASATAAAVLPTPVGPAMTSSGVSLITRSVRPALPVALQLAADVLHRDPADDWAAVRTEIRRPRQIEVRDEPLHLLACQRRVRLDRASARDECQRALHRRRIRLRPPQ